MDENHEQTEICFIKVESQVTPNVNENENDPGPSISESSKEKRNRRNFKEKSKILKELEVSSISEVCKKYDIGERLLRKWKNKKSEILHFAEKTNFQKSKQKPLMNELDDAVHAWFLDAIRKGIPVTGPIIQQKALVFNKELNGPSDFRASDGWLHKWKFRKNVRSFKTPCEELSADVDTSDEYKDEFEQIETSENLSSPECFNSDEDPLKFEQIPTNNHAPQEITQVFTGYFEKITRMYASINLHLQSIDTKLSYALDVKKPTGINTRHDMILTFLPLQDVASISSFDEFIATNAEAETQFRSLVITTGGHTSRDNIRRVLKKVFDDSCAVNCSWKGHRDNFGVCKLYIIKIIRDVICSSFEAMKEIEFETISSEWFRFAKQRLSRKKPQPPVITVTDVTTIPKFGPQP